MLNALRLWHSRKNWERLSVDDPLWAVLTDADKRGGRWDLQEFFRTGELDVGHDMARVAELWPDLRRTRALDFGCGVGRLTQALAGHFDEVTGVDISEGMLAAARSFDRSGGKVRYVYNGSSDLAQFADGSFDFIYSLICLQHIPPPHGEAYLREFARVLAPGGAVVFQVPSRYLGRSRTAAWYRQSLIPLLRRLLLLEPTIYMYTIPRAQVLTRLGEGGVAAERVEPSQNCGPQYESFRYYACKPDAGRDSAVPGQ